MMRIILQQDVPNLGVVGDLVMVRDGYARNYLIPHGMAVFASMRSVKQLEHQKRLAAHRRALATQAAQEYKKRIESISVCISAKVAPWATAEDGTPIIEKLQKLYGSITNRDLAAFLAGSNVSVEPRRVVLKEPIRTVGKFTAKIRLDGGVTAELPFWVIPEGSTDVESEKKRVEAAQEAARKEAAEAAALAAKQAAQGQSAGAVGDSNEAVEEDLEESDVESDED